MCAGEPAPIQTTGCWRNVRSITVRATARCGNGATAPGANPVAFSTSGARATRARRVPAAAATCDSSARASPGTSASTYTPSQTNTSDFTICARAQPTALAAASAVGGPPGNSCTRASTPALPRNVETRCTLSGHIARPILARPPSLGGRAGALDHVGRVHPLLKLRDELGRCRGIDRERHQRLAALAVARDRHVRDVDAGAAEQRPDPADHAGDVVVAQQHHPRRELHLDLEPERGDEPVAGFPPPPRPRPPPARGPGRG